MPFQIRIEKHADYIRVSLPPTTNATLLGSKELIETVIKGLCRDKVQVAGATAKCTPLMPPKKTKLCVQIFIQLPEKATVPAGLDPKNWAFHTLKPFDVELFKKVTESDMES